MRTLVLVALLAAGLGAGCGKEIGDACIVSSDCDPAGQRLCVDPNTSGYCTIQGCDFDTCPSESQCIRFFIGQFNNVTCDPAQPDGANGCSLDELCDLGGHCAPRSSEIRYCMRKCSSNGDCRDGYECRKFSQPDPSNMATFVAHGGEPVLAPGVPVDASSPGFCAAKPPS